MIAYLLKSAVCMTLLLLVYHFSLEQEKMHRFNRYFLIFSLIFSFTVPLFTIEFPTSFQLSDQINEINSRLSGDLPNYASQTITGKSHLKEKTEAETISFKSLFVVAYGIISFILLIRLFRNLYILIRRANNNPHKSYKNITLVLLDNCEIPYSFYKHIFVSRQLYSSDHVNEAILRHESAHVRQKHSFDILFIELLKIIFWFNPAIYFYKKAIQTNHEFLADQAVVTETKNVQNYQKLLLKLQSTEPIAQLASSIQFSITKKRIVMMNKTTSRFRMICTQLALIPLLAGLIFAFSARTTSAQNVEQMNLTELIHAVSDRMDAVDSLTDKEKKKLRHLVSEMRNKLQPKLPPPPPPVPKNNPKKALEDVLKAYQEHVRYYMAITPSKANQKQLKKEYKRIISFYNAIDKLQPKVYDNPPPLPPKPHSPTKRMETKN